MEEETSIVNEMKVFGIDHLLFNGKGRIIRGFKNCRDYIENISYVITKPCNLVPVVFNGKVLEKVVF